MKMILFAARILWIIAIPVLIISSTVNVFTGSIELYKYGFARYNISQVTHISNTQLEEAASMMISYFNGQSNTPQVKVKKNGKEALLYNNKELVHLEDVRKITDIFRVAQVISVILLIITGLLLFFKGSISQLITGLRNGAIISLGFTGVLVAWALVDFDSLFYLFHILSFNNDLWILDPSKDYLIMMFPQGFFNDAAMFIVGSIILESILLLVAALVMGKIFIKKPAQA
jgi:integral membrane protein (TIGR01906 family)